MQHTIQTADGRELHSSINTVLAGLDRQLRRRGGSRTGTPGYDSVEERQIFARRIGYRQCFTQSPCAPNFLN